MLNKLVYRVDILAPNSEQDSTGGPLPPTTLLTGLWADVQELTGREAYAAQQFGSDLTTKITVRKNENITARCQVRFDSKTYQISYVRNAPDAPRMYSELFCSLFNGGE